MLSAHTSGLEINIDTPVQVDEQLESASNPPIGMSFVDFLAVIFDQGYLPVAFGSESTSATDTYTLVATNQTEFTLDALPTRRGRTRRTRDMAEMYACICGEIVENDARIRDSETAMQCGYDGCETSWVRYQCLCLVSFSLLTNCAVVNSFIWHALTIPALRRSGVVKSMNAHQSVHVWAEKVV